MNARLLTTATLTSVFLGLLPARAADPQLLSLMMPDAKVLAGVNVDQAKATPFGIYVLGQVQSQTSSGLQQLINLTGFDPTRDVHELLAASNGDPGNHSGLLAARGSFDPGMITTAALANGATTETYKGVTIIEDPKQTNGVAFLSTSIAAAGDVASVKAAIDRQSAPAPLPANVVTQVNYWSGSQDAWAISTVAPSTLKPAAGAAPIPGVGSGAGNNAFQSVQSAAGGVKFGANAVVTAQAQTDTADNATAIGQVLQLLASMAQLQANGDPAVIALAKSLTVSTSGTTLNVSVSLPEDQLQNIVKPKAAARKKIAEKK